MKIHRVIIFLALMTSCLWGELPQFFLGPTIQSVDANEDTTALEVINQIKTAISKDKESTIALRIEVSDEDLANGKANMQVKNIPALIVIKYVADMNAYEFIFDRGIWVLKNAPPAFELKSDSVTLKVKDLKLDELTALGLRVTKNGKIEPASGKPWPSPSAHFHPIAIYSEGVFFAMLTQKDADVFNALIILIRNGYTVPKINT